jgi:hypothetical protein
MKLPIRRRVCVELYYDKDRSKFCRYVVIGAFSGIMSKELGFYLLRKVKSLPHSWYINEYHQVVRPPYRRHFTKVRTKLEQTIHYLTGTQGRTVKQYITKNGRRL